jgi:hypothetical protein
MRMPPRPNAALAIAILATASASVAGVGSQDNKELIRLIKIFKSPSFDGDFLFYIMPMPGTIKCGGEL